MEVITLLNLKYVVEVAQDTYSYNGDIIRDLYVTINLKNTSNNVSIPIMLYTNFINKKYRAAVPKTRENNAYSLIKFLNYIMIENKKVYRLKNIYDLEISHAEEFLNYYSKTVNKNTLNKTINVLRDFYTFLYDNGFSRKLKQEDISERKDMFISIGYANKKSIVPNHYMPRSLILPFIEVAIRSFPSIALGVYMQFFGGLRIGDIVSLKYEDITFIEDTLGYSLIVKITERNDLDKKFQRTSIREGVKKEREKQIVFGYKDIITRLYWCNIDNTREMNKKGYIFVNTNNEKMSKKVFRDQFNKLKEEFLSIMRDSNNYRVKNYALVLEKRPWSTHIGRGTFTNIIKDEIKDILVVAQLRGDSSLNSSIAYSECTPEVYSRLRSVLDEIFQYNESEVID